MATKTTAPKTPAAKPAQAASAPNLPAVKQRSEVALPAGVNFEEDAGAGMQHMDADSVAIPFLTVLQKMSPQCDPDAAEYNSDAKPGMFMNTVTGELFDGKSGVKLIPCAYERKFLHWAPRKAGGGFKGASLPEEVVKLRTAGKLVELDNRLYVPGDRGEVDPDKNTKVADTRVHYMLLLNEHSGSAQQVVVSLASTQIKKSKQLNSLLSEMKLRRPDGSSYTPATFANVIQATTIGESNDQGSWSGWKFELAGVVQDAQVYTMAKAFHKIVEAGRAHVNYDAAGGGADDDDGGRRRRSIDDGDRF